MNYEQEIKFQIIMELLKSGRSTQAAIKEANKIVSFIINGVK